MSKNEIEQTEDRELSNKPLKPLSIDDLFQPTEKLEETSARREWQIKRLQEKLGVSREIAQKMVDEGTHV